MNIPKIALALLLAYCASSIICAPTPQKNAPIQLTAEQQEQAEQAAQALEMYHAMVHQHIGGAELEAFEAELGQILQRFIKTIITLDKKAAWQETKAILKHINDMLTFASKAQEKKDEKIDPREIVNILFMVQLMQALNGQAENITAEQHPKLMQAVTILQQKVNATFSLWEQQ